MKSIFDRFAKRVPRLGGVFGNSALSAELINAAHYGDLQGVVSALARGACIDQQSDRGDTALMLASMSGHTDIVRLLIDRGADLDKQDKFGFTALMNASWPGHVEVVRLLIDGGADITKTNLSGNKAWVLAVRNERPEVVKLLELAEKNLLHDKLVARWPTPANPTH
jgi:ankyrin repeat protein